MNLDIRKIENLELNSINKINSASLQAAECRSGCFIGRFSSADIFNFDRIPDASVGVPVCRQAGCSAAIKLNNKGFSLLELMLVMVIVAFLSTGAVVWFFGYQRKVEVDSASRMVMDTLRYARSRSISGKDFKNWGVYFDISDPNGNKFVLFRDEGGGYASATNKEENYFSSSVKISMLCPITGVCLSGGGSEVVFNNLTGGTVQYGTANANNTAIRIEQSNDSSVFVDIAITSLGKIDML